jgi:hypothetical protein
MRLYFVQFHGLFLYFDRLTHCIGRRDL